MENYQICGFLCGVCNEPAKGQTDSENCIELSEEGIVFCEGTGEDGGLGKIASELSGWESTRLLRSGSSAKDSFLGGEELLSKVNELAPMGESSLCIAHLKGDGRIDLCAAAGIHSVLVTQDNVTPIGFRDEDADLPDSDMPDEEKKTRKKMGFHTRSMQLQANEFFCIVNDKIWCTIPLSSIAYACANNDGDTQKIAQEIVDLSRSYGESGVLSVVVLKRDA